MSNALITFFCIITTLGSLYIVGLPIASFLHSAKKKQADDLSWLIAPFIGLSVIILILQNMIYLNIPVKQSFIYIWLTALFFWVIMIITKKIKSLCGSSEPYQLLTLASGVYLLQGLGLLIMSATFYVGRGWIDQLNYTLISQFLLDHSLNTPLQTLILHPATLGGAIRLNGERIGVEIFQAFLAASNFTNTKTVFEPAIILSPFLVTLVMFKLAQEYFTDKQKCYLIAATAGCLPALTMIHLECFFSQAIATPFLLLWPLLLYKAARKYSWQWLVSLSIILAGATSIYSEYYLFFIGIVGLVALKQIFENKWNAWKSCLFLSLIIIMALLLNIGFFHTFCQLLLHAGSCKDILLGLYPWSGKISGYSRVWMGDFVNLTSKNISIVVGLITIFIYIVFYSGLFVSTYKKRCSLSLNISALSCAPLLFYILGISHYQYPFYKLFLSVSPLLPLGYLLGLEYFQFKYSRYMLIAMLLISASATASMTISSTKIPALHRINRGQAQELIQADIKQLQLILENSSSATYLISWQDGNHTTLYLNSWLSYFARKNNVWLTYPIMSDMDLQPYLRPLTNLPNTFLLLTHAVGAKYTFGKSIKLLNKNSTYSLSQVTGTDWSLLTSIIDSTGAELLAKENVPLQLNKIAGHFILYSGKDRTVTISGISNTDCSFPVAITLATNFGPHQSYLIYNKKKFNFSIPLHVGRSDVAVNLASQQNKACFNKQISLSLKHLS